ncbi:hypothetical protein BJ944DRAFT_104454 [Cunninghamella echinulata]|nr:hypothetical protein BJ944DRAFT_104454 [Cunninghamella echinulata]
MKVMIKNHQHLSQEKAFQYKSFQLLLLFIYIILFYFITYCQIVPFLYPIVNITTFFPYNSHFIVADIIFFLYRYFFFF